MAILGGAAFWDCSVEEAGESFRLALHCGVNHLDIAPSYGRAELVVGPHVPAVRDRVFVGAKTQRKAADGVRAQLEETLTRLGTDHVDLYQLHGVTGLDVLDERVPAAEEILRARDEGLTRFVGITGHDLAAPEAHLEAVRRWDLDTVMFPVFPRVWADPVYRVHAEALLAECEARDLGVMAIKAAARRPWGDQPPTAATWYEPRTEPGAIATGIAFALSTPGVQAFCTPGDLGLLPRVLDAADGATALTERERELAIDEAAGDEIIFPLTEKAVRLG